MKSLRSHSNHYTSTKLINDQGYFIVSENRKTTKKLTINVLVCNALMGFSNDAFHHCVSHMVRLARLNKNSLFEVTFKK